jgi:hypothetical protein
MSKGGFIYAHWDGTAETEEKIKELTKATIRCIPLNRKEEEGSVFYGKPSVGRVFLQKHIKKNEKKLISGIARIKIVVFLHSAIKQWPVRLSVRTPGFHPGKGGSIPPRATKFSTLEKLKLEESMVRSSRG